MIDIRPSTSDSIRHVVFRMWRRGTEELKRHGDFDNESIIRELCLRAHEYGYAFHFHGEPVAVFGAHAVSDKEYHTWFTATDKFHHIGKEATRFLKGLVFAKTSQRPDCRLELWSSVNHPDADRWFKLLGFHKLEPEGAWQRYVYIPRKRLTTEAKSENIEEAALATRPADQLASAPNVLFPQSPSR